jgi:hypothetical protein
LAQVTGLVAIKNKGYEKSSFSGVDRNVWRSIVVAIV